MALDASSKRPHPGRESGIFRSASQTLTRWTARRLEHQEHAAMIRSSSEETSGTGSGSYSTRRHNHTHIGTLARRSSWQVRQPQSGPPPPLTREDFEALPQAIQRKHFSTLERLRFAQESGPGGFTQSHDDTPGQSIILPKTRQRQSVSDLFFSPVRQRSLRQSRYTVSDSLAFASLPDKIKKRDFTTEEQILLTRHLPANVILDAADEAIYKIGRRASRIIPHDSGLLTPSLSSRRNSMASSQESVQSMPGANGISNLPESFYDSFRCLDEEEDLDLRLFLEDFHSNLPDEYLNVDKVEMSSQTKQRGPSFRRHLSISRLPFSRPSLSSGRPAIRDILPSPTFATQSPQSPTPPTFGHVRRKTRSMSLATPKNGAQESIGMIDPAAAHYQDPEARLKLRVYLASPQKFDEAIEFGFPSADIASPASETPIGSPTLCKRLSLQMISLDSPDLRTFLFDNDDGDNDEADMDDKPSLNSDQASLADPDSPKTPQTFEKPIVKPVRLSSDVSKLTEGGYAQAPASSREMTLRMTLTRPDLRAHEDEIYGWQKPGYQTSGRKSHTSARQQDNHMPTTTITYVSDGGRQDSMDKTFPVTDHWNDTGADGNMMKRIWNRVRRS